MKIIHSESILARKLYTSRFVEAYAVTIETIPVPKLPETFGIQDKDIYDIHA